MYIVSALFTLNEVDTQLSNLESVYYYLSQIAYHLIDNSIRFSSEMCKFSFSLSTIWLVVLKLLINFMISLRFSRFQICSHLVGKLQHRNCSLICSICIWMTANPPFRLTKLCLLYRYLYRCLYPYLWLIWPVSVPVTCLPSPLRSW